MRNPLSKTPFLFLLIPLLAGIIVQYYFEIQYLGVVAFFIGIAAMLFSYFIPVERQFSLRWLFGFGTILSVVGIGVFTTSLKQQSLEFVYSNQEQLYKGVVADAPQEKAKTTAYRVYLPAEDQQIVCYFQRDSIERNLLQPGDEFLFCGKIQPFRNMGNPDDFDYVQYMYNQGFVGSVYVSSLSWIPTGEVYLSLKFRALRCRQAILKFYDSLGFNWTEYGILSALTVGYQDALTDDLKQGFRTTGTVHVLSVSGLHVGVIYLMIGFLLGFIRKGAKYYWMKPLLIILLLWIYAFITGLPPSVVRASAMLSIFCVSEIFGRKNFSMHAMFIAAFFMLLINPFSLFDIGFQLSFMSVLSILYLQPKVSNGLSIKNKFLREIWQLFTLSFVAQLATFPICLYYFGTFPTYFFITNLIIVPLVSFIMYAVGGIVVSWLFSSVLPNIDFYSFPVKILQLLVDVMTSLIHFFESLPFALIEEVKISFIDLLLIYTLIVGFLIFFIYRRTKALIVGLTAVLFLFCGYAYSNLETKPNKFTVYNRRENTEIRWNNGRENYVIDSLSFTDDAYKYINIHGLKILVVAFDVWKDKEVEERYEIDNLVLIKGNNLSLYSLTQLFSVKNVVLDASLSVYARRKLSKECQKLNIPCHDVTESGAFSLFF